MKVRFQIVKAPKLDTAQEMDIPEGWSFVGAQMAGSTFLLIVLMRKEEVGSGGI